MASQSKATSSLARLQSLDAEYKSPVDRLLAAARIAGIRLPAQEPPTVLFCRPRTEWVLRWLLEKLKDTKETAEGRAFRSCSLAWQLLDSISKELSVNSLAAFLNSANVLQVVKIAFDEWLLDSRTCLPLDKSNGISSGTNGAVQQQPATGLRKRKRDADQVANVTQPSHQVDLLSQRLDSILQFIWTLTSRASDGPQQSVGSGHERLRTLLRLDPRFAATVLETGFTASTRLHQLKNHLPAQHVATLVKIWTARSMMDGGSSSTSAVAFAELCLVPVCLLMVQLNGNGSALHEEDHAAVSVILERLILDNIIHVGHFAFTDETRKAAKPASSRTSLYTLLDALRQAIAFLQAESEPNKLVDVLPIIFKIVAQNTSRKSLKSRTRELPWLEKSFRTILSCARSSSEPEAITNAERQVLIQLVMVASSLDINFSPELTVEIASRYTGLTTITSGNASLKAEQWYLIKLLLEMNGDVFTDTLSQPRQESGVSPTIGEALATCISQSHTMQGPCQSMQKSIPVVTASDIVSALLSAYVRRNLVLTFVDYWINQLIVLSVPGVGSLKSSPWTSPTFIDQIASAIGHIPTPQLQQLLRNVIITAIKSALVIRGIIKADKEHEEHNIGHIMARMYAAIIVSESVMLGIRGNDAVSQVADEIAQIRGLLQKTLLAGLLDLPLTPTVWRILTRIQQVQRQLYPSSRDRRRAMDNGELSEVLRIAEDVITTQNASDSNVSLDLQRNTYGFLLSTCCDTYQDEQTKLVSRDSLNECTQAYLTFVTGYATSQSLLSTLNEYLADLQMFSNYSSVFVLLNHHVMTMIFEHFLSFARLSSHEVSTASPSSLAKLSHELQIFQMSLLHTPQSIFDQWTSLLLGKIDLEKTLERYLVLEDLLLAIDFDGLGNSVVKSLADACVSALTSATGQRILALAALHKLSECSRLPLMLTHKPRTLIEVAKRMESAPDTEIVLFDQLVHRLFQKLAVDAKSGDHISYFSAFDDKLESHMRKKLKASAHPDGLVSLWMLVRQRLSISRSSCAQDQSYGAVIPALRQDVVLLLLALTARSIQEFSKQVGIEAHNRAIIKSYHSMLTAAQPSLEVYNNVEIQGQASTLMTQMTALLASQACKDSQLVPSPGVVNSGNFTWTIEKCMALESMTPSQRSSMFKDWLLHTGHDAATSTLSGLDDEGWKLVVILFVQEHVRANQVTSDLLLLQSCMLKVLDRPALDIVRLEQAKTLLPLLAHQILQSTLTSNVGYGLADILAILQTKPFMISQHGVEAALSAISALLWEEQFGFLHTHASATFIRLCQIINTVLSLHRRSITGRMHVLIPLLHGLLNPFFILHTNSRPSESQRAPPWLASQPQIAGPIHATAFARILLTLTQPTVTSATVRYRGNDHVVLTDATRKARQYAAQFVPYIIAHFCNMQLLGRLDPEVRKSILPGIHACIEAMPREGLRGMNAGLSKEERAIWAGLYADWNRSRSKAS